MIFLTSATAKEERGLPVLMRHLGVQLRGRSDGEGGESVDLMQAGQISGKGCLDRVHSSNSNRAGDSGLRFPPPLGVHDILY